MKLIKKIMPMPRYKYIVIIFLVFQNFFYTVMAEHESLLDFFGSENPSRVVIRTDILTPYTTTHDEELRRIIFNFPQAKTPYPSLQSINTTDFNNSNINLIEVVQPQDGEHLQIIIHLKKFIKPSIQETPQGVSITVPYLDAAMVDNDDALKSKGVNAAATQEKTPEGDTKGADPNLTTYFNSSESQNFTGKLISLNVKDANVRDILELLGVASGFNMVISEDVKGTISLSLEDVPWDQVLDIILQTVNLGAERNGNVLRVLTLKALKSEKEQILQTKIASSRAAKKNTKIFSINYADLGELQKEVQQFSSLLSGDIGSSVGGGDAQSTNIQIDQRTNSLIAYDTPENLKRIEGFIHIVDIPARQIMIEARIIEASKKFSNGLSTSFGLSNMQSAFASVNGAAVDPLVTFLPDGKESSTALNIGLGPVFSILNSTLMLRAFLNMNESEGNIKTVGAPKTVVLNKENATLTHGTPVLIQGTTTVPGVGAGVPTSTMQQANISLNVTPTITNDNATLLTLSINKDTPVTNPAGGAAGSAAVATRSIKTKVMVDDGNTLVIGGLYQESNENTSSGVPFFKNIPILKYLFSSEALSKNFEEIFMFITPTILHAKKQAASAA